MAPDLNCASIEVYKRHDSFVSYITDLNCTSIEVKLGVRHRICHSYDPLPARIFKSSASAQQPPSTAGVCVCVCVCVFVCVCKCAACSTAGI